MKNILKFSLFCVVVVFCESRDSPSVSDFNSIRVPRSTSDSHLILLKRQIEKMGAEIHNMKEGFVNSLEKLKENFNDKLLELEEKVVNKIHGNSEDVRRLTDGLDSLQTELAEVSNKTDSISEKIRVDIEQVSQKMNDLNTTTESGLDSTKSILNGRIDQMKKELESKLSVSLNENFNEKLVELEGKVVSKIHGNSDDVRRLSGGLDSLQTELTEVSNKTDSIKEKIGVDIEQVTQKVNELNTTTESGLDSTKSILNGRIDEIKKELESELSVSFNQNFNEKLVELEGKVVTKIHGNSDDVRRLSDGLESLQTELAEVSNKADSIREKIRVDIEQVTEKVNELNTTTKSGLDAAKSILNGRIDEIKKELESKLSVSLNQIIGNETIGKDVSLLESNEREDQGNGCGGIVVADEGFISFKPDPSRVNTEFTCIWTIRANLYEKVAFTLKRGNVGADMDTILFASPLNAYIFNNASESWTIERDSAKTISRLNKEYFVEGPVVFLTLVANISSSSSPQFQVYFKGHGGNTTSSKEYRHYHFGESEGELDYPKIRGVATYSANEVSTFVFNPHPPRIELHILKVDLETHPNCEYDALTILVRTNNYSNYYTQRGHLQYVKDWRYCMADKNTTGAWLHPRKAFIVTFNSDGSNQKSGFKLSWKEK